MDELRTNFEAMVTAAEAFVAAEASFREQTEKLRAEGQTGELLGSGAYAGHARSLVDGGPPQPGGGLRKWTQNARRTLRRMETAGA